MYRLEVLLQHAEKYTDIFDILLENRDIVDRVTFWGVSDGILLAQRLADRGQDCTSAFI